MAVSHTRTVPDFLFTRQDAQGLPVAVYLDGLRYHACAEHNRTADDARLRRALRGPGLPGLVADLG